MNENQKFEQIWGFRRNLDSSSDDSRSNSNVGLAQEKLRLIPSLVLPEQDDRVSETNDQKHVQPEKKAKRARNGPKNEKNKNKNKKEVKTKPKKDSCSSTTKKNRKTTSRKKKSKSTNQTTVSNDFQIFTETILDDLRKARETMFAKMRKEMDQLITSKKSSRLAKKTKNGSTQAKKPNQKPRSRKPKQNTKLEASKGQDCVQEQVDNEKMKDPYAKNPIFIDSSTKNPILIDSSAKKPIFTKTPDKIITSSSSLTNLSGLKGEEQFRNFGQTTTASSCVGNAYGLNNHSRFNHSNTFGLPNHVAQGFLHDGNVLGSRMMNGGGIRLSAGLANHALPNHYGSNVFRGIYPN